MFNKNTFNNNQSDKKADIIVWDFDPGCAAPTQKINKVNIVF